MSECMSIRDDLSLKSGRSWRHDSICRDDVSTRSGRSALTARSSSARGSYRDERSPVVFDAKGFAVLEKFGCGRIKTEQCEELRKTLIRDLEAKGLPGGRPGTAVQEEVEKFLQNGHISGSNLSRLQRRVFRRLDGAPGVPSSARGHQAISDFSAATRSTGSRTPCPLEARSVTPGSARGFSSSGRQALGEANPKWSEVANYAKVLEQREKAEQRSNMRSRQHKMRNELLQQMAEKEHKKTHEVEEGRHIFEMQKVELQAWQEAEDAVYEEQKRIAMEVRKEREIQKAVVSRLKEDEQRRKREEDEDQMRRTKQLIDQEQMAATAKKRHQRDNMVKLMTDWSEDRRVRQEDQKRQDLEETFRVDQYQKLLAAQEEKREAEEARKRTTMNTSDRLSVSDGSSTKAERLKKERQREEHVMTMIRSANAEAAEAEIQKTKKLNQQQQLNQDFLCKQMMEREMHKQAELDKFKEEKDHVLAEAAEFLEWENQRIEQQRMKNIQHRFELEKQMNARTRKKVNEDFMSAAEVAMNRNLLEEARLARDV